jgi:hypothetical protein
MDIDPRARRLFVEFLLEHPGHAIRVTRCKGG